MEQKQIDFSIVIPLTVLNDYVRETCQKLQQLSNRDFEVIIVANDRETGVEEFEKKYGAKIIAAGDISPAIKRDIGVKNAQGKYIAFIDDDAYPNSQWLDIAKQYLEDEDVAAIGGPQLTPPNDSFWQKVSGAMFMSPLSGKAIIRYWPGKKVQTIDDWPTVNFIIKKDAFNAIGGFDSKYWPGEDTKLCLDVVKKLKKKIMYVPELIVYHHRRSGLKKHVRQVGNYGIHRGYFAKVFPETSIKFERLYFMPSLFVLFVIGGFLLSFYSRYMLMLYAAGWAVYVLALVYSVVSLVGKTKNIAVSVMTVPYMVTFHVIYGIRFMQGYFFTKDLKSKLGR